MWLSGGGSARVVHRAEHFSTAIVVLSDQPQVLVPIKEALKDIPEIVHSTVEVHPTLQRDSEPGQTPGNDFH